MKTSERKRGVWSVKGREGVVSERKRGVWSVKGREGCGQQECSLRRTVFDLAKTAPNLMLLQQESNSLDIIFFMGATPRVSDIMQLFPSF